MLGCEDHRVIAVDRGGAPTVFDLSEVATDIEWARLLDETSEASVRVVSPSAECCEALGRLRTWRHELQVYRGPDRVWEGPLRVIEYGPDEISLYARDVSGWLEVRKAEAFTGVVDSAERAYAVIRAALAVDDPNVRPYVQLRGPSGQQVSREVQENSTYAIDEIRDLAAVGMDWTVLGRSIIVGDTTTEFRFGLNDEHFRGAVTVTDDGNLYGSEWTVRGEAAAAAVVPDGEEAPQVVGIAGGESPYFGLVQRIIEETVETNAEAVEAAQERVDFNASGPPLVLDISRDATLLPEAPVSVNSLVPGAIVDVFSRSTCREVSGTFRLVAVRARVRRGEEQIGIALVPYSEGGLL